MTNVAQSLNNPGAVNVPPACIERLAPVFKKLKGRFSAMLSEQDLHFGCVAVEVEGRHYCVEEALGSADETFNPACDGLMAANRHPLLLLAAKKKEPFDLFVEEETFFQTVESTDFISSLRAFGLRQFACVQANFPTLTQCVFGIGAIEREMSLSEAIFLQKYFQSEIDRETQSISGSRRSSSDERLLSPRERQCILSAAAGYTEKETAKQLGLSQNTVHVYLENCKRKLKARNKTHASVIALRTNEISFDEWTDFSGKVIEN